MGNGVSRPVSASKPCPLCGKNDWCNYVTFPDRDDELFYCKRKKASIGDTVQGVLTGQLYFCSKITPKEFYVYEELSQYQRRQKEKDNSKFRKSNKGSVKIVKPSVRVSEPTALIEGQVEPLSAEKLDRFYRKFLSLLVLEKKHEEKLRMEWDMVPGMFERITSDYPIKSIPPADKLRFSSGEKLENDSRKKIMEQLIAECGEPKGVPYFYQRSYDDAWTFADLDGICYPVLDTKGRIVRLIIGDDHPMVYKRSETIEDDYDGIYRYMLDTTSNKAGWYYIPYKDNGDYKDPDYTKKVLVYSYLSDSNKITLNAKGYPEGKVKGKYKKASSFLRKEADGKVFNFYRNGSKGGAFCSLYTKEGDDNTVVYITEGEKKSIVANEILGAPVICIPGTGNFRLLFDKECGLGIMDHLVKQGVKVVVIAFDADKKVNAHVLQSEQELVRQMNEEYLAGKGIRLAVGEWNAMWGKGIDDALLAGVKPVIHFVTKGRQ